MCMSQQWFPGYFSPPSPGKNLGTRLTAYIIHTYMLVVSWVEPVPTFIKTSSIVVRDKPKLEKPKLLLCPVESG